MGSAKLLRVFRIRKIEQRRLGIVSITKQDGEEVFLGARWSDWQVDPRVGARRVTET